MTVPGSILRDAVERLAREYASRDIQPFFRNLVRPFVRRTNDGGLELEALRVALSEQASKATDAPSPLDKLSYKFDNPLVVGSYDELATEKSLYDLLGQDPDVEGRLTQELDLQHQIAARLKGEGYDGLVVANGGQPSVLGFNPAFERRLGSAGPEELMGTVSKNDVLSELLQARSEARMRKVMTNMQAFEPRRVEFPQQPQLDRPQRAQVEPVEGLQPTDMTAKPFEGSVATGPRQQAVPETEIIQLALQHDAADLAAAQTKPVDLMAPADVPQLMKLLNMHEPHDPAIAEIPPQFAGLANDKLDETATLLRITDPTIQDMQRSDFAKVKTQSPKQAIMAGMKPKREGGAKDLGSTGIPHIDKAGSPLYRTRIHTDPLNDLEPIGKLPESGSFVPRYAASEHIAHGEADLLREFESISEQAVVQQAKINPARRNEMGYVSSQFLTQMVLGSGGAYTWWNADKIKDPGLRRLATTTGAVMMFAAGVPTYRRLLETSGFTRTLAGWFDVRHLLTRAGEKKAVTLWNEMVNYGTVKGSLEKRMLKQVFKTPQEGEMLAYAIDEGMRGTDFALLTPKQQDMSQAIHGVNLALGRLLEEEGILNEYRADYFARILPPKTFESWKTRWGSLSSQASFSQPRTNNYTLREVVQWARAHELEPPLLDPGVVQAAHNRAAYKAIANARLRNAFVSMGVLKPAEKASSTELPLGWKIVEVTGMDRRMMAPEEVARAMEVLGGRGKLSDTDFLKKLDVLKSYWMVTLNIISLDHILNMFKAGLGMGARSGNFTHFFRMVKNANPIMLDWARYGLALEGRPDFAPAMEGAIGQIQEGALKKSVIGRLWERQERVLFDELQPAVALMLAETEKLKWLRRGNQVHLPGSETYNSKMREIAGFANRGAGLMSKKLQDPQAAMALRMAFFAPTWRGTRLSISAHAAGDIVDVVSGAKGISDAMHLKFKLRQLAIGAALTYGLSKVMSGKAPEFKEDTYKYYIRTGMRDRKGRELGIDLLTWYQDDIKAFNDPLAWLWAGANPMLKASGQTLSGRDNFGRPMSIEERVLNFARSFGPPVTLPEAVANTGASMLGGQAPNAGENIKAFGDALMLGNTSGLPRQYEIVLQRKSKQILEQVGIPTNADNIYELQQLMFAGIKSGQGAVNPLVIDYLARKRFTTKRSTVLNMMVEARKIWRQLVD